MAERPGPDVPRPASLADPRPHDPPRRGDRGLRPRGHRRALRVRQRGHRRRHHLRLDAADRQGREGHERHREGRQLVELARVHRRLRGREEPAHPRRLHQEDRHQGQLHRGLQRQRRVLRQGAPAARGRPGHRARRLVQHRLDGRPPHPPGLRPEARHREHPQRQEPRGVAQGRRVRPGPRATPCRGRAASPASRTTSTPPAARRSRRSPSCSRTRPSRARSPSSPRCATPSGSCSARWARTRPTSPTPTTTRRSP